MLKCWGSRENNLKEKKNLIKKECGSRWDYSDYRPFLDWVDLNDDLAVAEINFIKASIQFNHQDITGLWGYLLEFFDSVGLSIATDYVAKQYCFFITFMNTDKDNLRYYNFKTRQEAQTEATKKALELIISMK